MRGIMRLARLPAATAVVLTVSLLAACGGGGGGNAPTPPVNPGPSGVPTASSSPAGTPTPTPAGTATPTPVATATPTPVATATPTPAPTGSPTSSSQTVAVGNGEINGTDDLIKTSAPNTHNNPGEGDLMPNDPGAAPGGGGQGAMIDGITCDPVMASNYHIHVFVGIIYNGQEVALPDAIGMVNPSGEFTYNGAPNQEIYADCFYHMHTHDASGMVHLEAPSPTCGAAANWNPPCNMSIFTLGNLLDIWGISLTQNNFGPLVGPVTVYSTPQQVVLCGGGTACYTPSSLYQQYNGNPAQINLYSHMAVWIVIGSPQPATPNALPNVEWINGSS
jgi:hypothetical protein